MINQNRSTGAHRAAGSSAVQMPPCKYPDSPVHDWSIRELKAIYAYAQSYAAQQLEKLESKLAGALLRASTIEAAAAQVVDAYSREQLAQAAQPEAHRAAGELGKSATVKMPPLSDYWTSYEQGLIRTYAQAYAAQQAAERDARVKVLEEALTCISKSHPKYEGGWTLDATISDFGGNADDYARERALMLHASTGSKARAALSNHTPTKEQIK